MPIVVERNKVNLTFPDTEFARGENKGKTYPAPPEITPANRQTVYEWVGYDILDEIITARLRQKAQGWYNEATEDDGTFKLDVFVEFAKNFSARGESIPELKAKIDELLETFSKAASAANMVVAQKVAEEIKACKIAINSKRRKTKEEQEVANAL